MSSKFGELNLFPIQNYLYKTVLAKTGSSTKNEVTVTQHITDREISDHSMSVLNKT